MHLPQLDFTARSLNPSGWLEQSQRDFFAIANRFLGKQTPLSSSIGPHPLSLPGRVCYIKIWGSDAGWATSPSCLASWGSCSILTYLLGNSLFFLAFPSFWFLLLPFCHLAQQRPSSASTPAWTCPSPLLTMYPSDQEQFSPAPLLIPLRLFPDVSLYLSRSSPVCYITLL